jgi:hypothetical protein
MPQVPPGPAASWPLAPMARALDPILIALTLSLVLSPSGASAVDDVERDNFLSKVQPSASVLGFDESFNGYSGRIAIRLPGPTLKGKGGLDLIVRPYYNSEIWNRSNESAQDHVASIDTADHLGGNGWQLHFGKVINPTAPEATHN